MKTFALLMGLVCGALGACTTSMELPKAPEVPQPRPTIEALTLWQWEQPRAQLDEPRFHFKLSQVPVLHVLEALSLTEALGYEADECALQTVSLHVQNMPLSGVVRALERQAGLRIRQDSNHWHVQCASPETRVYNLDYLDLQRSLQDSSSLSSALDRRGQSALTGLSGGVGGNNLAGAGVGTGASSHGDSGNQSRLLLVNQQVHDLWNRLALHLEFLLGDNDGIYSVRRQASTSETEVQNQEATLPTRNDRRTNRSLGSTRSDQTVRTQEQIRLTGRVVVHPESGTVTIRALPEQHELVEQWLGRVQQRVDKQVLVEAVIAEISLNQRHERGIDWTLLKTQGTQLGLNIQGVASESPAFTLSGRRSGLEGDLQGVLRLLEAFGQTRVVSSPRVMTMSQQAAVLKVIDNRVYFTTEVQTSAPTNNNPAFSTFNTVAQTVPVGFLMTVNAQVGANQEIQLRVRPTITRIVGFVSDPNPALRQLNIVSQVPEVQTRELEALLKLKPGDMALLGGLKQDSFEGRSQGLPGVASDLQWLSGSERKALNNSELVVLLRASLVGDDNTRSPAPKESTPLNQRLTTVLKWAQSGRMPEAQALLEGLLNSQPHNALLTFNKALLALQAGNTNDVRALLPRLMQHCPQAAQCDLPLLELQALLGAKP